MSIVFQMCCWLVHNCRRLDNQYNLCYQYQAVWQLRQTTSSKCCMTLPMHTFDARLDTAIVLRIIRKCMLKKWCTAVSLPICDILTNDLKCHATYCTKLFAVHSAGIGDWMLISLAWLAVGQCNISNITCNFPTQLQFLLFCLFVFAKITMGNVYIHVHCNSIAICFV